LGIKTEALPLKKWQGLFLWLSHVIDFGGNVFGRIGIDNGMVDWHFMLHRLEEGRIDLKPFIL
ncbi:MAG: hypothetical protein KDC28_17745, partial [Saprospiraceae bacterium]|nr:hypothetical protein [Saprospiraceae bacterium]